MAIAVVVGKEAGSSWGVGEEVMAIGVVVGKEAGSACGVEGEMATSVEVTMGS
jgi:hypothetical protein